jgi:hypothetical protein
MAATTFGTGVVLLWITSGPRPLPPIPAPVLIGAIICAMVAFIVRSVT